MDLKFAQELKRNGKKFCVVLTKIDSIIFDYQAQLDNQITPKEEAETIERLKMSFKDQLAQKSLNIDIYALSALMSRYNNKDNRNKYEFKNLQEKILTLLFD